MSGYPFSGVQVTSFAMNVNNLLILSLSTAFKSVWLYKGQPILIPTNRRVRIMNDVNKRNEWCHHDHPGHRWLLGLKRRNSRTKLVLRDRE